jgi:hypothetical protein
VRECRIPVYTFIAILKTLSKEKDFDGAPGGVRFRMCDCQNNTSLLGGLKHLSLLYWGYPGVLLELKRVQSAVLF